VTLCSPLLAPQVVCSSSSLAAPSQRQQQHQQQRLLARPAVAEKMSGGAAQSQFQQPAGKGLGFYTGEDGYLYCDNLRVDDIRQQVSQELS
jgi:hypothetical protein